MKKIKNSLKAQEKKRFLDIVDAFKQVHILVIGDFILDQFVWGSVNRISPEAPVPVVNVERESFLPGGSLNVANNVRTLKGTVYPCGVVGRDLEGRVLTKAMRREGIETGGVVYDTTRRTSLKTRIIAHSQQMVRFDREKVDDVSKSDLKKILKFINKKMNDVDVVIVEDYGKGLIQPFLLKEILKMAKKRKKPVLVDPKEKHFSYYKGVTVITPNRKEAYKGYKKIYKESHKEPTVEQVGWGLLKKLKLEAVLLTLGEDGIILFEKNKKITRIPTMAKEVYDVSGAGDTVIAIFALSMAARAKMKEAANFATCASSS